MIYLNDDIAHYDWQAALPLLSEQRREQVLRFRYELGRCTCVAAHMLLCEGLQREYGIMEPPVFDYGEHGKPLLKGHPDIHFNMSHCSEAAICVLSERPVGVDVERIHDAKPSLVSYTMNPAEQRLIEQSANPAEAFTRLWTQKEAVLKLCGTGITDELKTALSTFSGHMETVVNQERQYIYTIAT